MLNKVEEKKRRHKREREEERSAKIKWKKRNEDTNRTGQGR